MPHSERRARLDAIKADLADRFGWKPIADENGHFRALDGFGRMLWLKIRTERPRPEGVSWDWSTTRPEPAYDALIAILVSRSYDVLLIVRATRQVVDRLKRPDGDPAAARVRFRWNDDTRPPRPGVAIIYPFDGSDPTLRHT